MDHSRFQKRPSGVGNVRFGQKQTFALHQVMSALSPKAHICSAIYDVRFGPISDITSFGDLGAIKISMTSAYFQSEGDRPRIIFLSRFYFTSAKSQKSRKTIIR